MVSPEYMATTPKRSNHLHNFTLPSLKWGTQRYLRCAKSSADASGYRDRRSPASWSDESTANWTVDFKSEGNASRMRQPRIGGVDGDNDDGIDAVRKKLVLDLKTAAEKMKDVILRNKVKEEEGDEEARREPSPPPAEEPRPWNLRTRRREDVKSLVDVGNVKRLKIEERKPNSTSPAKTNGNCNGNGNGGGGAVKLPKLRSNTEKTKQREKFSVALSKKEIEEDFAAMVGRRPPRRPIKRPKDVQKKMDMLFPGLWLREVTADWYKVPEEAENGGKARKGKGKMLHLSQSDVDDDDDE